MNKSIVLITLFAGFLVGTSATKANPLDPRHDNERSDQSETSDDASEKGLPQPQTEE